MKPEHIYKLLASHSGGAITESELCLYLSEIAGEHGADEVLSKLSDDVRNELKKNALVASPPARSEEVFITHSYCGPRIPEDQNEMIRKAQRKTVYRGGLGAP